MEVFLTIVCLVLLAAACCLSFLYLKQRKVSEEAQKEAEKASKETDELKGRLKESEETFQERLRQGIELEKEKIEQEIEQEYNDAIAEQEKILGDKIQEVDNMLGERIKEIAKSNTVFFTCSCDKSRKIPVQLDLSKENRFTCENCNSTYRVEFNAYPVLLSNVSNNRVLANIFSRGKEDE